jgi:hypothetical protein
MATQSWVENACCLVKIQALDKASPCHQHVRFDGYQEKSQGGWLFLCLLACYYSEPILQ